MKLSIVTTLYQSAQYLREFHKRVVQAASHLTEDFEVIFVNDGSPDDSLAVALELFQGDRRVRVIDLSRNFGHHKAMMTGLEHAVGERIFLIDCDLEEDPEWLILFDEVMAKTGAEVAFGVQEARKGGFFESFSGELFYSFFNFLADCQVPRNIVTARLMTDVYVRNLVAHREREIFLLGLWQITGFTQVPVTVKKHSKGETTYTFAKKLEIVVNSITSFSNRPLVFIFYLGLTISLLSGVGAMYLIIQRLFFGVFLQGWPSLIVSIWLLGGITIFCLGIIGMYLSRTYMETKQRPYTIIRRQHEHTNESPGRSTMEN